LNFEHVETSNREPEAPSEIGVLVRWIKRRE
jgi:hypothetical protein